MIDRDRHEQDADWRFLVGEKIAAGIARRVDNEIVADYAQHLRQRMDKRIEKENASMSIPCGRCNQLTDPAELDQCVVCRGFEVCPKCMLEHNCDVRMAQR